MRIKHWRRFAVFSCTGTVSLMPLLVLPAMIGVLVDNAGMSDSSAGWSASLNFVAGAAMGLLLSFRIHHVNLRHVATIALVCAALADGVSAMTAGESIAFFAARLFAGLALGAVYVASVSSFARYDGYERGFGMFVTLQFTVSGLGLYIVPIFADALGAEGLFGCLALIDCLALLLVRKLPAEKATTAVDHDAGSEWKVLMTASAILALLGFAAFEAAANAQFTYIERFGVALDVSDQQIGLSLLIASLIGIPGAFSIVLFGQRFGTFKPLAVGIAIACCGQFTLLGAESYTAYFIGGCLMGFSWAFCLPFIQSLLASIDRKGSAIAAGTALSTFGSAAGPGIAAIVVVGGRYDHVFMLSISLFILAVVAFYFAWYTRLAQK